MKKQTFIFVVSMAVLFSLAVNSSAQEKGFSWGAFGTSGNMCKEFSTIKLEALAGYNFTKNFSSYLKAETDVLLLHKEGDEKHYQTQTLGLMLKYNVYKFNNGILDLRAGSGTNLFNKDWRYLYWDIGLFLEATREMTKPTIGIGFRYYDTIGDIEKNYPSVYVSVGFIVN